MTYVTFKAFEYAGWGAEEDKPTHKETSIAIDADSIFAVKGREDDSGNKSIIFCLTAGEPYSFEVAADVTEVLATIELART